MAAPSSQRLIALAAGVVQEFPAEDVVLAAAQAGFNAVGIWCELDHWSDTRTDRVRQALAATGLTALDIEVAWFRPGEALTVHDRFVAIANQIGAKNLLCVSSEPDISRTKARFEHLCRQVEGTDVRIVLEFLPVTEIDSLTKALEVVNDVAHPAGGILVDTLHLQRTGVSPAALSAITQQQPNLFPYFQICDAPRDLANSNYDNLLEEALYLRKLLGDGELPLEEVLGCVDDRLPLSLEIRARALIDGFPNLKDRAAAVFASTQRFFHPPL